MAFMKEGAFTIYTETSRGTVIRNEKETEE
jgi:hypothetical protein